MNGLTLLGWILGLAFLWLMWMYAVSTAERVDDDDPAGISRLDELDGVGHRD